MRTISSSSSSSSSFSASSIFIYLIHLSLSATSVYALKGIDVDNPVTHFSSPLFVECAQGTKDALPCERVRVSGISRLKIASYASAYRVTLAPSVAIPEILHSKLQICFHKNASLRTCHCEAGEWKAVYKGIWASVMSPYEDRYLDVKFVGEVSGPVTVTVEEEFQQWRVFCLALGFVLQLLAPSVSNWVPFYYSSSMAIEVLIIMIIFFQVSVLVLVLIILAGAVLGYWFMRKFVISEDGTVDIGIAHFVKWAIRVVGFTSLFQSSLDTPLALSVQGCCLLICFSLTRLKWHNKEHISYPGNGRPQAPSIGPSTNKHAHTEFLSRSGKIIPCGNIWKSPRTRSSWTDSPVRGLVSPTSLCTGRQQDFYSTFHKTLKRKKFSKQQWEDFTEESTRQALTEWASTAEFTEWVVKNADRVKVVADESSDDSHSGSDSNDDITVKSINGIGVFGWQQRK